MSNARFLAANTNNKYCQRVCICDGIGYRCEISLYFFFLFRRNCTFGNALYTYKRNDDDDDDETRRKLDRVAKEAGWETRPLFFSSISRFPALSSDEYNQTSRTCIRYIANVDSEYICPAMEERRYSGGREGVVVVVVARVQILCRLDAGRRSDHRRIIPPRRIFWTGSKIETLSIDRSSKDLNF